MIIKTVISAIKTAKNSIDIRDLFVIGGLALLAYGLYLFLPWVAYVVMGALLFSCGILMKQKERR